MSDKQRHCIAATYGAISKDFWMSRTIHSTHSNGSRFEVCFKPDGARGAFHRCGTNFLSSIELQYLSLHYLPYLPRMPACCRFTLRRQEKRVMLEDLRKLRKVPVQMDLCSRAFRMKVDSSRHGLPSKSE